MSELDTKNTLLSSVIVVKVKVLHDLKDEVVKQNLSPMFLSVLAALVEPRLVLI